jgi:hypothetical protein
LVAEFPVAPAKKSRASGQDSLSVPPGGTAIVDIEAFIFAVMDMQRRPGTSTGLKNAQGSVRRVPRRLHARIARQAGASPNHIARQKVGHEIHDHLAPAAGSPVTEVAWVHLDDEL